MRKLILALGLATFALSTTAGCVVHRHSGTRRSSVTSKGSKCHPSQYWDGERCRHKGKGKGARKHDR